jgi:Mn-containing catalase
MGIIKDLLVDQLKDLLDAENQLVEALPKMAEAANDPKLKEAFEKHLAQTEHHQKRLAKVFELLGEDAKPKRCRAMAGLVEEASEQIKQSSGKGEIPADLDLVASAQKVEHYEISGYGTARSLARMIGQHQAATLLSHTLGEEEAADYLLTEVSKPLIQEAAMEELQEVEA